MPQVELNIFGITSGPDQGNHGSGYSVQPAPVVNLKLIKEMSVLAASRKILAKSRGACGEQTLSVVERLKEGFVGGVLKPPYAAFLVTGKSEDVGGRRDIVIGVLQIGNRLLRVADLPDKGARDEQQGHYWKQQSL